MSNSAILAFEVERLDKKVSNFIDKYMSEEDIDMLLAWMDDIDEEMDIEDLDIFALGQFIEDYDMIDLEFYYNLYFGN